MTERTPGRPPLTEGGMVHMTISVSREDRDWLAETGNASKTIRKFIRKARGMNKRYAVQYADDDLQGLYEQVVYKVNNDEALQPYEDVITYDWDNAEDHYRWILSASNDEIIDWAKAVQVESEADEDEWEGEDSTIVVDTRQDSPSAIAEDLEARAGFDPGDYPDSTPEKMAQDVADYLVGEGVSLVDFDGRNLDIADYVLRHLQMA